MRGNTGLQWMLAVAGMLACSTGGDSGFLGSNPQPGDGSGTSGAADDGATTDTGGGTTGDGTTGDDGDTGSTGATGNTSDTVTGSSGSTSDGGATDSGTPSCGDGVAEGLEACDGTDLGGQTCSNFGFSDGQLVCSSDCSLLTDACFTCGDGTKQTMEACDDADFGGEDCVSQGFGSGSLACASDCASIDTSGCQTLPSCGDGSRNGSEQCEGTDYGGATCETLGWDMGTLTCNADCTYNTTQCMDDNQNCKGQMEFCMFDPNDPQGDCCPPGVNGNILGICDILFCV